MIRNVIPDAGVREVFFFCFNPGSEGNEKEKEKIKQSSKGGHFPSRHFKPIAGLYNVTGDTCYRMVAYNICNYNVPVNLFTE